MNLALSEVKGMSFWEFAAVSGGYRKAHCPDDEQALTSSEADALANLLDAPPIWERH